MNDSIEWMGLAAALLMGLAGSAHCFGMCGGLASAFGMRVRQVENNLPAAAHAALYQIGRITGYALLGGLCGAFGQVLQSVLDLARLGGILRLLSGVLLLLVAARLLWQWNGLAILERAGARIWRFVQPLARRFSGVSNTQTFALGLIWGLLPCGMVYSMLAFAALSGSATQGALLLMVFGLGTAPSMFVSTFIAARSVNIARGPWMRRVSGVLLIGFAAWLIAAPLSSSHADHSHHSGHAPVTAVDSP